MSGSTEVVARRRRDPNRRAAILDAAARLVARHGYVGVSMADIGAEVGIAASAIYWHFASKQALLVALFDECLDRLSAEEGEAVRRWGTTRAALEEIVRLQVDFVVDERAFARVYYAEMRNLPATDLRRLRGKQRDYVSSWADLIVALRPGTERARAEALVHASIGAVQSVLVYRSAMPTEELKALLTQVATQVLETPSA